MQFLLFGGKYISHKYTTIFPAVALQILASFGTTLSPSTTETYGADTTFTFAAGTLNTGDLSKPALSE